MVAGTALRAHFFATSSAAGQASSGWRPGAGGGFGAARAPPPGVRQVGAGGQRYATRGVQTLGPLPVSSAGLALAPPMPRFLGDDGDKPGRWRASRGGLRAGPAGRTPQDAPGETKVVGQVGATRARPHPTGASQRSAQEGPGASGGVPGPGSRTTRPSPSTGPGRADAAQGYRECPRRRNQAQAQPQRGQPAGSHSETRAGQTRAELWRSGAEGGFGPGRASRSADGGLRTILLLLRRFSTDTHRGSPKQTRSPDDFRMMSSDCP